MNQQKKKTKTSLHDTFFPENCLQPVTQLGFCVMGMSPVLIATSLSCRSRCREHTELTLVLKERGQTICFIFFLNLWFSKA